MPKFCKKPVEIEAVRWEGTEDSLKEILAMVDFGKLPDVDGYVNSGITHVPSQGTLDIPTLEGVMKANLGDWIIKGIKEEIYPCKPDIFEATYEPVEVVND